jgi:subtilisin family serine protease
MGPSDGYYSHPSDGTGVNIYIVDSGVWVAHPDFTGRAHGAWTYNTAYPADTDCSGHGTAVASVAAGAEYGVARGATIWSVRTNDCDNWQWVSDRVAGVDYVIAHHVKPAVLNFSVGTKNWMDDILPGSMNDAVKNAWHAGIFVAVSAGNDGADACNYSPANAAEVVTVGSIQSDDTRYPGSNHGPCVDVYAPGHQVMAALHTGGYGAVTGTSFAAPYVSGVAAAWLERFPTDPPLAVWRAMDDGMYGYSRILYSNIPVAVWADIAGPDLVSPSDYCEWIAQTRGGRAPFQYVWSGVAGGSGFSTSFSLSAPGGTLYLDVYDSFGTHFRAGKFIVSDPYVQPVCAL